MARIQSSRVPNADDGLRGIVVCSDTPQKQKARQGDGESEGGAKGDGNQKLAKRGEELKAEMDALVDEIDDVLEENAEEFVKNYVQRGGE